MEWSLKQKLKGRLNKLLHFTISLKYTEVLQNTYTDSLNIYYRNSYRTRLCKVAHLPLVANGISMRRGYGRRHSRLKLSCVGQQGCSFSPAIPRYPLASGIALYTITPFLSSILHFVSQWQFWNINEVVGIVSTTSCRSESSNISLVVLDLLYFTLAIPGTVVAFDSRKEQ